MAAPEPPGRAWLRARAGVLVAAVVIAAAAPSLPRGVGNWDNIVKLQLARSLLRGHGLVLEVLTPSDDHYVQLGADGRRYSTYPPSAAFLHVLTVQVALLTGFEAEGVPALLLLGLVGWAVVSWGIRAGRAPAPAMAGALLCCLGTALWPSAALGYDVLVEVLALALVLRAGAGEGSGPGAWLLAGAGLGLAFTTRLGAVLLALPAAVAAFAALPRGIGQTLRRGLALGLGAAPFLLLLLWYNVYRFGAPLAFQAASAVGANHYSLGWFSAEHLQGMVGLLLSPGKGIFWYSPPLLAVAATAPALIRRNRVAALALGSHAAAVVLVLGNFVYWHGDWGWGPRYLAPLLLGCAPLAWLLSERLEVAPARARALAFAGLVGAVLLQAAPVVGRPIPTHFALVLGPLAREGRLVTSPVTAPPLPGDYGILYYAPQHSMLVSLARGLARSAGSPALHQRLRRALLVPLAVALLLAGASLAERRRAIAVSPVRTP